MRTTKAIAAAALAAAGLVHVFAAQEHATHMMVHGTFLLLLGIAQLGWALLWLRWTTRAMALAGIVLSGGVVLLWLLLNGVEPPWPGHLAYHARTPSWDAAASKAMEILGCGILVWYLWRRAAPASPAAVVRSVIAPAAGTILAAGALLWGVAVSLETLLPPISSMAGWPTLEMGQQLYAAAAGQQGEPAAGTTVPAAQAGYGWQLPHGFPLPRVPADNPMTAEKVELGRYLFYDRRLSANGMQACESCHLQALAFSDGKVVPSGSTGQVLLRNSPALVNVAYYPTLTWANPVLTTLERQLLVPLFGEFPVEMGLTGHETEVLARLRTDPRYVELFAAAFPEDAEPITYHNVVAALASFVRSLVSGQSAYDRYIAGDKTALTPSAVRGMELFFSERFECHHCHTGFNFSAATVQSNSTFSAAVFQNNGLYNVDGHGSYPAGNRGVFEITNKPQDMGRFRPPSLRNVELTAPYMHDGSLATLEAVVRHYAAGGSVTTEGPNQGDGRRNPYKSPLVPGFTITDEEVADLAAFLRSLTDPSFVADPRYANPFAAAAMAAPAPGTLTVTGVAVGPAPLAGGNGAVYLTVVNGSGEDVQLLAANSSAAAATELHETVEESGMMRMDPHPEGFAVPAGGSLVLKPGGKHVMLVGLARALAVGDSIDLALQFGNGQTITVTAPVTDVMGSMGPMPMDMQDHGATVEPTAANSP